MDLQLLSGFFQPVEQVLGQVGHYGVSQGVVFLGQLLKVFPLYFKQDSILSAPGR